MSYGTTFGEYTEIVDPPFFDIQAGYLLMYAIILPYADATISIGTTEGADDISSNTAITAAEGEVFHVNRFSRVGKRIYFTGLPQFSTVVFYLKKMVW